ncbi:hypothetical protein Pmani_031314, partial [Petrolisthes manimaculis]
VCGGGKDGGWIEGRMVDGLRDVEGRMVDGLRDEEGRMVDGLRDVEEGRMVDGLRDVEEDGGWIEGCGGGWWMD